MYAVFNGLITILTVYAWRDIFGTPCGTNKRIVPNKIVRKMFSHKHRHLTKRKQTTVELQWPEHLWDVRKLFETWIVRATEGYTEG